MALTGFFAFVLGMKLLATLGDSWVRVKMRMLAPGHALTARRVLGGKEEKSNAS